MKKKFLDLGLHPLANSFISKKELKYPKKEYFYKLSVGFDTKSCLVSLMNIINPKRQYTDKYAHRASQSTTMNKSFINIANILKKRFKPKILAVILLGLFIAYSLFGLNGLTVIFWTIALCVGYGLLLASMRIWQKREIRKYHKKHKTIPKTYEDLEKHLKSSISVMPHLKKKLTLPNVTLLAVTSVEIEQHQISLKISSQNIEFRAVKLLSSSLPEKKYSDIEYVSVTPMSGSDQNRFLIKDLHKYFETSHCLYVEADSFVVNADLWKEEFLEFDYIGAPWPDKIQMNPSLILNNRIQMNPNLILNMKENCVGNGGFSLRSRKLLKTVAEINYDLLKFPIKNEDIIICHYLYKEMIDKGIRFASPELAAQFSIEDFHHLYGQDVNSVFGFHSRHMRDYFLKEYMRRASIYLN